MNEQELDELVRSRAFKAQVKGDLTLRRREIANLMVVQCPASPWHEVVKTTQRCTTSDKHDFELCPDRDGVVCLNCGLLFLGGPTHIVDDEDQKLRDRGLR